MLLFNICTLPWWLPWLLLPLLGLLLGWLLWGRFKKLVADLEAEISRLKATISGLESDLGDCNSRRASIDSELTLLRGQLKETEANNLRLQANIDAGVSGSSSGAQGIMSSTASGDSTISIDDDSGSDSAMDGSGSADSSGDADGSAGSTIGGDVDGGASSVGDTAAKLAGGAAGAQGIMGSTSVGGASDKKKNIYAVLKSDNLQVVEGIGPKMNEVLSMHGVATWKELGALTSEEVRAILDKENPKRYRIIDPTTWPTQAQLAHEGKWEELIALQKKLDTGRANVGDGQTDSKVEKLLIKLGAIKKWKQDDLKAVEGIGPKIEGLLKAEGIDTWRKLAQTEVSRIQEILDAAGPRYKLADPGTWPKQSEMAADGRWDDLDEYQDFLQGGK